MGLEIGDTFGSDLFAEKRAKKGQKEQKELIAKQRQVDELALAEKEDELERRRQLAKSGRGGRQSLIKTSETGVSKSTNLGGTT